MDQYIFGNRLVTHLDLTYKGDGIATINKITANRGNCAPGFGLGNALNWQAELPKKLKFGDKWGFWANCDIVELIISYDGKEETFTWGD